MFLTMGLVLAVISTITEIMLVQSSKMLDKWYTKGIGPINGTWVNTIGSFILSAVLGALFTADGLVVMFGAAVSTGLSQMYFAGKRMVNALGWNWARVKRNWNAIPVWVNARRAQIHKTIEATRLTIILVWKIITAPVRASMWVKSRISSFPQSTVNNRRVHTTP